MFLRSHEYDISEQMNCRKLNSKPENLNKNTNKIDDTEPQKLELQKYDTSENKDDLCVNLPKALTSEKYANKKVHDHETKSACCKKSNGKPQKYILILSHNV